jgi:alginate O-acetyltransferase complex protein AlgI
MSFNSTEFFVFVGIIYLLYRILAFRGQNMMLLIASYVFYGWWDTRLLFLIVLSTVIDFNCGLMIESGRLTRSNRYLGSWSVIFAALVFGTLQWNAVQIRTDPLGISVQWGELFPLIWTGWLILLGALALIIIANLLYNRCVALKREKRRQLFLWIGICCNLGILGFLKYCNFFLESAIELIRAIGMPVELLHLSLIVPIGISFYTFKAISYVVDIYKGKMEASDSLLNFALFLGFFPTLLAGPIDRASQLLPQLSNPRSLSLQQSSEGVFLILFGLFKKVAIADGAASSVNAIYQTTGTVSWIDVVLATFLFTIQIYCDFSGYSDAARGVSKLFGIELVDNFDLPYFSQTPSEFWRRWHISLSTWLRDYLYIPLGGSRQGERRTYQNLMVTMVLGGLWHGAAWNFILWGFYQGGILCLYRALTPKIDKVKLFLSQSIELNGTKFIWGVKQDFFLTFGHEKHKIPQSPTPSLTSLSSYYSGIVLLGRIAAILFFFIITCYGWLLFGAISLAQVITFTKILFTDFGNLSLTIPKPPLAVMLGIPLLIGYEFLKYAVKSNLNRHFPPPVRAAFYATLIFILLMGTSNAPAQFIYSQF